LAIVSAVDTALAGRGDGPKFVGSHPIAGDQRTGVEHARADLFDGRTVVVTPTGATDPPAITMVTRFWESLGAHVVTMNAEDHDATLAATSHLPHLVAAALARATPPELIPLTAGGWRDTTRVAGGDPRLWRPIFASNRQHVLAALDGFERCLAALRTALADEDDGRFEQLLQEAKRTRDALGD
jgi:prephenate dehydrogenase